MAVLLNRNKNNLFKKRHYKAIIDSVAAYCTTLFGYRRKPFLFEGENPRGELMYICRGRKNRYAIFYDYMQFKKTFADHSFETQEVYTAFLIAHEMRHYYQMRQLDTKTPIENSKTLAMWRENDQNPKFPDDNYSVLDFYMQPMELDAQLFAYLFVVENYDSRIVLDYIDESYVNALEAYYIQRYGKTSDVLFPH